MIDTYIEDALIQNNDACFAFLIHLLACAHLLFLKIKKRGHLLIMNIPMYKLDHECQSFIMQS